MACTVQNVAILIASLKMSGCPVRVPASLSVVFRVSVISLAHSLLGLPFCHFIEARLSIIVCIRYHNVHLLVGNCLWHDHKRTVTLD